MTSKNIWVENKQIGGFAFTAGTRASRANATWFRGESCNYGPSISGLMTVEGIEEFVLGGWLPEAPFIDRQTKITAFGSCFAANISKYLAKQKFRILTDAESESPSAYVVRFGEGMVNTYAILQQFEWAFEGKAPQQDLWHGYDAHAFGYDEKIRLETRAIFDQTDVFIITLGLSEIWYDEPTGEVFWRAVPQDYYDPSRHKFRVASVSENLANLRKIVDLIRRYRPSAKVLMTLSPIPLVATFRHVSCVTANSVSKANLRAAVDELMREHQTGGYLFYWPSYEIVTEVFRDKWLPDRRHIKPDILEFIMMLFEKSFCRVDDEAPASPNTVAAQYLKARVADGTYDVDVVRRMEIGDIAAAKKLSQLLIDAGFPEVAEPLVRRGNEIDAASGSFSRLAGRLQKLLGRDHQLGREKVKSTQLPVGPLSSGHIPVLEEIVMERKERRARRRAEREAAEEA